MSDSLRRILGVGQGSCASPSIWMAVLDPILWSIAAKFKGFNITTPSGATISQIGDAYVDDAAFLTALHPQGELSQQIVHIAALMGNILQDFERKLYSTGEELSLKIIMT